MAYRTKKARVKNKELWLKRNYLEVIRKSIGVSMQDITDICGRSKTWYYVFERGRLDFSFTRVHLCFEVISKLSGLSISFLLYCEMEYQAYLMDYLEAIGVDKENENEYNFK